MEHLVNILVPVYSPELSANEKTSLKCICHRLSSHPITLVKPKSLDVSFILNDYPFLGVECFDDAFFKGIEGYNRLMLTPQFYERFLAYRYILIAQLDTYFFSDTLEEWCLKDYDYIGAPWLYKPLYKALGLHKSDPTLNQVGNGGLSLRKVISHLHVTTQLQPLIQDYLKKDSHWFHEDVFFALEPHKAGIPFFIPSHSEALSFSFDKYPRLCYKMNRHQMPFGCHGWNKKKMRWFWRNPLMGFWYTGRFKNFIPQDISDE